MSVLNWNNKGFSLDGKPAYIVSGEFHYFRVPHGDWARRMELLKEAGGNCIATYVPWLIHEPEEGNIIFGDRPERDLEAFLKTAVEVGINVILRPGPYQYSELLNDGLPTWLIKNYPEIGACNFDGSFMRSASVSYLHPIFLEKARKYYKTFADIAGKYMSANGGPVVMVQLDNELGGIHVWNGTIDANPETMGFGREDGRYAKWLKRKFGTVEIMNGIYNSAFRSFADVRPVQAPNGLRDELINRDYSDFYCATMAEYLQTLASWLREDGITVPVCHNSANPNMNPDFVETASTFNDKFLLGSDHYYSLNPGWIQNNPTQQHFLKILMSCEQLRAMGMPPTVFELPAGNIADTPPITPEDLLACYMLNTACGMKAHNYYIYTGGPNFPGTGTTCEVYDYHAPVSANGECRDIYYALQKFGLFLRDNAWMQNAERETSVQLGLSWAVSRFQEYQPTIGKVTQNQAWNMLQNHILYAYMCSSLAPEIKPICGELDISKPLTVVCPSLMSHAEQKAIVDFIERGGNVILTPVLPEYDENGKQDTLLADYIGISGFRQLKEPAPFVHVEGMPDVYILSRVFTAKLPNDAEILVREGFDNTPAGCEVKRGKGRAIWLGAAFNYMMFEHAAMLENLSIRLGAKKLVESSDRNIFTSMLSDGKDRMLFVMNLFSSNQRTDIKVHIDGKNIDLGHIELKNMEVKTFRL